MVEPITCQRVIGGPAYRKSPVALFLVTTDHSTYANVHGVLSRLRGLLCAFETSLSYILHVVQFANRNFYFRSVNVLIATYTYYSALFFYRPSNISSFKFELIRNSRFSLVISRDKRKEKKKCVSGQKE